MNPEPASPDPVQYAAVVNPTPEKSHKRAPVVRFEPTWT